MKFAVVKTGGKQYLVRQGQKLKIEKLEAEEGVTLSLGEVLIVVDGDSVLLGTPNVAGAMVEAKVLKNARSRKVIVFKYRPKARSRVKRGHRQHYTEVEITKITN
ncbi:MAG: 50S ribosomal protein L21 [Candidatus Sungbacteria bacterium]|nr:50S ribosomal protein L21 [Candidatus Sungbacteria bacterium]